MTPLQKYYLLQGFESGNADTLILNTNTLNLARVLFFNSYFELNKRVAGGTQIAFFIIPGYNISLVWAGSLQTGTRLQFSDTGVLARLTFELQEMGNWFLINRIETNPKKYRKWNTYKTP